MIRLLDRVLAVFRPAPPALPPAPKKPGEILFDLPPEQPASPSATLAHSGAAKGTTTRLALRDFGVSHFDQAVERVAEGIMPAAAFETRGLEAVKGEITLDVVPWITGRVPKEISGTFFRNGPGKNEVAGERNRHFFDGDGMIAAFQFEDGRVSFRNRFVRTEGYVEEAAAHARTKPAFGTLLAGGPLANIGKQPKNAANTSVLSHNGQLLALYEGGLPHALDPKTLETKGAVDFGGTLKRSDFFAAHPKTDPKGGVFAWGIKPGPQCAIQTWALTDTGISKGATFKLPRNDLVHDVAVSERRAVFFGAPITMKLPSALEFITGFKSLGDSYEYDAKAPLYVHVLDRTTGAVRSHALPNEIAMHTVNAYENADGDTVVDYIGHREPTAWTATHIRAAEHAVGPGSPSEYKRIVIGPQGVKSQESLAIVDGDFPRINDAFAGREHRYAYTVAFDAARFAPGSTIVKTDAQTKTTTRYDFGGDYQLGEASYVARGEGEDDGWLMCMLYDQATNRSSLAILEANAIEKGPVAIVHLPLRIPLGFHGDFVTP